MKYAALALVVALVFPVALFADHGININSADKDALTTLTGIGDVKAQAIIDYRETHGAFTAKADVQNVSGIGPATYESIKDHIVVSGGAAAASPSPASSPNPSPAPSSSPNPSSSSIRTAPPPPPPTSGLFADSGGDRIVVAGAAVEFQARAHDTKKDIEERVRFTWNFGDGTTGSGGRIAHTFAYPGRYAVMLTATLNGEKATNRILVTADEAKLELNALGDGGVSITNHGANDVDVSGWRVHASGKEFFFPPDSLVLAGETVRVPRATLGFFATGNITLRFQDGTAVPQFSTGSAHDESEIASDVTVRPDGDVPAVIEHVSEDANDESDDIVLEDEETSEVANVAAANTASGTWKWWGAASLVALLGGTAVAVSRRYAKKEWDIVEDTAE